MKDFKGKVAIVTGGGGTGIGNALVRRLAAEGAHVAYCDVAGLDKTEADLSDHSGRTLSETVDIADREAVSAFIDRVVEEFGGIDLLINNAGIALGDRTFEELTLEDLEKITGINYWGVIHTTKLAYPHMIKRPAAAVVNLSSTQGILAAPYLIPYCTTKFAVRGFTDALRAESRIRGHDNFQVHTVHPGAVATNITRNADYQGPSSDKFHELLQTRGASPDRAAEIILDGVKKNKGRIFISDGRIQDVLTRLMPTGYIALLKAGMKRQGSIR